MAKEDAGKAVKRLKDAREGKGDGKWQKGLPKYPGVPKKDTKQAVVIPERKK